MFRNYRDEKEKELFRFFEKYFELQDTARHHGTWVDVEPYQRGWSRKFTLRDDAANRSDAQYMRQVLDLVNTKVHSRRKDFQRKNWKTGEWENIPQKLKNISVDTYNKLSEKMQSYFSQTHRFEKFCKKIIIEYTVKSDYYYVYEIEPLIITQQWVPDSEIESLLGEMQTKINRNNLWVKYSKIRSRKHKYFKDLRLTLYEKTKLGDIVDDDNFEILDDVA